MTKEKYLKEIKLQESIIESAKQNILEANRQYIEANREFQNGEKIAVYSKATQLHEEKYVRDGFITGARVDYYGQIKYSYTDAKKDGTPSKRKRWIYQPIFKKIDKETK